MIQSLPYRPYLIALLGFAIAWSVATLSEWNTIVTGFLILLSFGFSVATDAEGGNSNRQPRSRQCATSVAGSASGREGKS